MKIVCVSFPLWGKINCTNKQVVKWTYGIWMAIFKPFWKLSWFLSKGNTKLHAQSVYEIEFISFGWQCPIQFIVDVLFALCDVSFWLRRLAYCSCNKNEWLVCVLDSSIQFTHAHYWFWMTTSNTLCFVFNFDCFGWERPTKNLCLICLAIDVSNVVACLCYNAKLQHTYLHLINLAVFPTQVPSSISTAVWV